MSDMIFISLDSGEATPWVSAKIRSPYHCFISNTDDFWPNMDSLTAVTDQCTALLEHHPVFLLKFYAKDLLSITSFSTVPPSINSADPTSGL